MADKPLVIDVEFQLLEHRWRWPIKSLAIWALYVFAWAGSAWQSSDKTVQVICVVLAALTWPVIRWICTVAEKVSPEQADLLRHRMTTRDASPRRRLRRLPHQSR